MRPRFLVPLIVLTGLAGLGFLIFAPIIADSFNVAAGSSCQARLQQIGIARAQYLQDTGGAPLPISVGDRGWAEILSPYLHDDTNFQCPAGRGTSSPHRTDYFYNAQMVQTSNLKFPERIISFGDASFNSGANNHLSELPLEWREDGNAVTYRHKFGANYVFADGHVKSLRPQQISKSSSSYDGVSHATFATK